MKDAPAGSPVAERLMAPPTFTDAAVTVKLTQVPSVTVWFPGIVSEGAIKACTLIVVVAEALACGEAESVTVRLAIYDPAAEYVWVVVAPVPVAPSPNDMV